MRVLVPAVALWVGFAGLGFGAETLESTLAKLDRSAASFQGMEADLKQTAHTAVVDDDQVASGTIRMKRNKPGDTRMVVDFTHPDPKDVQLAGQTLSIYYPKTNTVQTVDMGNNSSLIEQFLLLGFGTSSKDLAKSNDIHFGGGETVNGHAAVRLDLVPKSKEVLQRVEKIQLWLSPDTGYPVQHKIFQPGGDYQLFQFSGLRMNPSDLSDASVKLKLPKNVKTERLQQ